MRLRVPVSSPIIRGSHQSEHGDSVVRAWPIPTVRDTKIKLISGTSKPKDEIEPCL